MLVLLIIFMVITPMLGHQIPVNLAQTRNPIAMADADKDDALVVAIRRDGRIFLGTELIGGQDVTSRVKDRVGDHPDRAVYIRADARARYEYVVSVVDDVRSAGADHLGLLTEQVQTANGALVQPSR